MSFVFSVPMSAKAEFDANLDHVLANATEDPAERQWVSTVADSIKSIVRDGDADRVQVAVRGSIGPLGRSVTISVWGHKHPEETAT